MRWVFRGIAVLVGLLALAIAAVLLVPSDKVANLATAQFEKATGRSLQLEGGVSPTIWPVLGVKTGPVTLANAAWSDKGPMLRAKRMQIGVDMAALWGGAVKITEIVVDSPEILLERNTKGQGNWEFSTAESQSGAGASATEFTLDKAEISGGSLQFLDHATGQVVGLDQITLSAAIPKYHGPADLRLAAVMKGQHINVITKVADFGTFLTGKLGKLVLDGTVGKATLALDGRAGFAPLMAEGKIKADLSDLGALTALAGMAAPALPEGFGARKITLDSALTLTSTGSLHLRGAKLDLDGQSFAGEVDLTTDGARPKLVARIDTGALALPKSAGSNNTAASGTGWSKDPIDATMLNLMNAELALQAQSLDLGTVKLGATSLRLTIDRGRAVFDIAKAAAYEGVISGQFVVNARKNLSIGGDLRFSDLSMQPLLTDLAGYDRLLGRGNVGVNFLASGNNLDAIMRSLSGTGTIRFGKGELRGLDIAGMLKTLDPNYIGEGAKTIFDSVSLSFAMQDGVAHSEDLALAAPLITATGAGDLDLGGQAINYRLMATALAGIAGAQGVTVPILIKGPWAGPKVKLDLDFLAKEKIDAEKARLKARAEEERMRLEADAKAQLAAKAKKELGLEVQSGESIEQAAKRRANEALEAEAARALNKLFGGGN